MLPVCVLYRATPVPRATPVSPTQNERATFDLSPKRLSPERLGQEATWENLFKVSNSFDEFFQNLHTPPEKPHLTQSVVSDHSCCSPPGGTKLDWTKGEAGVLVVKIIPNRAELARRLAGGGEGTCERAVFRSRTWSRTVSVRICRKACSDTPPGFFGIFRLLFR